MKIGIFGGSFDPVHNAHVALARTALDQLALDEVRWIPAGEAWQKVRGLAPAQHRIAMVTLAIADESRYVLDRCEVDRQGPSYTLDTVRELQALQPDARFFLIIGQDQYSGLHTWHGFEELLSRVVLAVANRPGTTREPDEAVRRAERDSVALPMMDISSTAIRQAAEQGEAFHPLVPDAVARYIEEHRLYRGFPRS